MLFTSYRLVTRILHPILPWFLRYRLILGKEDPGRWRERMGVSPPPPPGRYIWFHAPSIGESLAILPLVEWIIKNYPDLRILLTTTTFSSAQFFTDHPAIIHRYAPLDIPGWGQRFLDQWQPLIAVWVETSLWPNILDQIKQRSIPLILANGRMSDRTYRFWQRFPTLSRQILGCFSMILAQNATACQRLTDLGAKKIITAGNIKLAAKPLGYDKDAWRQLRTYCYSRLVWAAISTHAGEEEMIAQAHAKIKTQYPNVLTIIVPRHPHRSATISDNLKKAGFKVKRRSLGSWPQADTDIYLADTLGEVGLICHLVKTVYIGHSIFKKGYGHNPIEMIRLGCATMHGPYTSKFREIYADLDEAGASIKVLTSADIAAHAGRLWSDDAYRLNLVDQAQNYLRQGPEIVATYTKAIKSFMPPS